MTVKETDPGQSKRLTAPQTPKVMCGFFLLSLQRQTAGVIAQFGCKEQGEVQPCCQGR